MAWSILSVIPKVRSLVLIRRNRANAGFVQAFLAQVERDAHMKDLLKSMNYAYDFVAATESLQTIKSRSVIIENLAQQTTECAYFIRDYAAQQSFGKSFCASTIWAGH